MPNFEVRKSIPEHRPGFYEFFAGGGMARAGLGEGWRCLFANDFDPKKVAAYRINWGSDDMRPGDVNLIRTVDLPQGADLAWASFPCQDLSLAGNGLGIGKANAVKATRSGTFWAFAALLNGLRSEGREPSLVVLENVHGLLTSKGGRDFAAVAKTLADLGYRCGAVLVDARHFVPQSRPRIFFIAVRSSAPLPKDLIQPRPIEPWHPPALVRAAEGLSRAAKTAWIWWRLGEPPRLKTALADIIGDGEQWHPVKETNRILGMMSATNRAKIDAAKATGRREVGGVYFRTRIEEGKKVQRAEVRFDGLAGCLRTPRGGSSRQRVLVINGYSVRSRLLTPRETANLMGLPETYVLPEGYTDACHVTGDGVAAPVVAFLRERLLDPLHAATSSEALATAAE